MCLFAICVSSQIYAVETIRMSIGDTKTLSPSILPSKVLAGQPAWTSSRPTDVSIESFTMYSCTIKAKNSFSGYARIQCVYRYRELDPVTGRYIYQRAEPINYNVFVSEQQPTSIIISPTEITMEYGATKQMSVSVLPASANQKVTWTTTNPSVATVNEFNVLGACGYGSATVTATTKNGLKATCKVLVPDKTVNPTSVTLPKTIDVEEGSSIVLTPTLTPSNANSTFSWSTSDSSIASVSNEGKVKGNKLGTVTVTVKTENNLSAKCKVTVVENKSKGDRKKKVALRRIDMLIDNSKNNLSW